MGTPLLVSSSIGNAQPPLKNFRLNFITILRVPAFCAAFGKNLCARPIFASISKLNSTLEDLAKVSGVVRRLRNAGNGAT